MEKNSIDLEKALKLLVEKDQTIEARDQAIQKLEDENRRLNERIQQLLHERYGKKTEKLRKEDLPVLDEAVVSEEVLAEIQAAEEDIQIVAHSRQRPKRRPLPAEFKREIVVHDIPEEDKFCTCGQALHCVGEDTSEKLDYIPGQIKVIRNVRKNMDVVVVKRGL